MSFQSDKSQLKNAYTLLSQKANQTTESWKDSVQERFYDQFVNSLPKEVSSYLNELNKLDKSFNSAELHINELLS